MSLSVSLGLDLFANLSVIFQPEPESSRAIPHTHRNLQTHTHTDAHTQACAHTQTQIYPKIHKCTL